MYDSGVHMWGRLKPGITRQYAEASLEPLAQELVRQHPGVLPPGLKLIGSPGGYAARGGEQARRDQQEGEFRQAWNEAQRCAH